ncbi:DNA-binding transcriptional regulator CsiR [Salmonella enterica subsp. diarizonae]|nr:DNA-binding transcriptional regulator CsiR [Salmonella enterica subsp. diarizonae]
MTALSQPTAIDGYRWLKNDIIRGTYQPDEKLRMSLLTSRYALGVGPLREALSQLVAERLVTVVNQKGYRVASMSEAELLDIFDARANMEAMLVRLAIERGDDAWEAEILARAHMLSKLEASDASEHMLDEWDQRHQAFHSAIVAGAAPTICYRCANDYSTWRPATALFGYVKPSCLSRCWKINISSITR